MILIAQYWRYLLGGDRRYAIPAFCEALDSTHMLTGILFFGIIYAVILISKSINASVEYVPSLFVHLGDKLTDITEPQNKISRRKATMYLPLSHLYTVASIERRTSQMDETGQIKIKTDKRQKTRQDEQDSA